MRRRSEEEEEEADHTRPRGSLNPPDVTTERKRAGEGGGNIRATPPAVLERLRKIRVREWLLESRLGLLPASLLGFIGCVTVRLTQPNDSKS